MTDISQKAIAIALAVITGIGLFQVSNIKTPGEKTTEAVAEYEQAVHASCFKREYMVLSREWSSVETATRIANQRCEHLAK